MTLISTPGRAFPLVSFLPLEDCAHPSPPGEAAWADPAQGASLSQATEKPWPLPIPV